MKEKPFKTLAFALATTICVSGCNRQSGKPSDYLLVLKTVDNPFFVKIEEGVKAQQAAGDKIVVRSGNNESDVQSQISVLESFAPQPDSKSSLSGLIITPASSGAELVSSMTKYAKAGIPVILLDTAIEQAEFQDDVIGYNVLIQSDNHLGGVKAARLLVERLPKGKPKYNILLLEGALASDTAKERSKGFATEMERISKDRNIVISITSRTADWRRDVAQRITSAFASGSAVPDGIFAANDEMALGALNAFEGSKDEVPPIVGFDAIPEALAAAKSGRLAGTIAQDPGSMGKIAMKEIKKAGIGQSKYTKILVPVLTCSPTCK